MASSNADGFNENNLVRPLPKLSRIIIEDDFLFITLTKIQDEGFKN